MTGMSSQKKKPTTTDRQTTQVTEEATKTRAATKAPEKPAPATETATPAKATATTQAQKMAKGVGNQAMNERLQASLKRRDDVLAFISGRLHGIREKQLVELDAVENREKWERRVSWNHKGFTLPQPTRWNQCAEAYKQAAKALCAGNLSRGVQLLDRALELERVVQKSFPTFLEQELRSSTVIPTQIPDSVALVSAGEGCPRTALPKSMHVADDIIAVRENARPVREWQTRSHKGWWEAEEEDATEKGDKTGDKKAAEKLPARKKKG